MEKLEVPAGSEVLLRTNDECFCCEADGVKDHRADGNRIQLLHGSGESQVSHEGQSEDMEEHLN